MIELLIGTGIVVAWVTVCYQVLRDRGEVVRPPEAWHIIGPGGRRLVATQRAWDKIVVGIDFGTPDPTVVTFGLPLFGIPVHIIEPPPRPPHPGNPW